MRSIVRLVAALGVALIVSACSVTAPVYGIVGDDGEIYTGTATGGMDGRGTLTLTNSRGARCIGTFRYVTRAMDHGIGLITCSDGDQADVQFNALSMTSGYGFGTSRSGRSVKFAFGLSREEAAQYIGGQAAATPPPGGGQPPAGTPGQPQLIGTGSGFFISRQGHVLTNAHVTEKCTSVTVQRPGTGKVSASILSQDRENDVAVVLAPGPAPGVAVFRAGRPIRLGEPVVSFGFPLTGMLASGGVLTTGSVSALAGLQDDTRYIQMSAPIQPGNSGGPVFDSNGLVIGISTLSLPAYRRRIVQNANFAVKNEVVATFLSVAGVGMETAPAGRELSPADIGDRARTFTVRVECLR